MNPDLNVIIVAPLGQDAKLTQQILETHGIGAEALGSVKEFCERFKEPSGMLFITEEAISNSDLDLLHQTLQNQESWSDFPIILVTSEKQKKFERSKFIIEKFGSAGNISLLERPFSLMTLVTVVKVAIRAREKQYQIRELIGSLSEQLLSKDEFMSIASHELRTPMTNLKLQVQLKLRGIKKQDPSVYDHEKLNRFFTMVDAQVNKISRLVEDMMDLSKISNGKLSLNEEEGNLDEVVALVVQAFEPLAQAEGIELRFSSTENLRGSWDMYRLEQIITNLLSNGIKYGKSSVIDINVYKTETHFCVDVRDYGQGISPKNQARIFERYERGKEKVIGGLGLGLYISRQIAEMHGGSLTVESEEGKGSTFKLSLPG